MQAEYSLFALDIEHPKFSVLETCRELGIAVVAYSPLGRGVLAGQLKSPDDFEDGDFRKYAPRYNKENFPKNLELVRQLAVLAKEKGCTSGQLSLAWLLAQGGDIIPIPYVQSHHSPCVDLLTPLARGTKRVKYLEENVGALRVKLTEADLNKIRDDISKVEIQGDRYPPFFAAYSFADTPVL